MNCLNRINLIVLTASLFLQNFAVYSFSLNSCSKLSSHALKMAGGRSPAEVGLTKKQLFQQVKSTLNTAAEDPGFFEVGDKPEFELFCKSNKDGTQIGDCPFAQFIQMVMLKKGIRYAARPILSSAKPDWLVEKHDGKLPAVIHNGVSMTDSLAIAEYIEKSYPHSSLTRQGAYSYQEVLEKVAGFFPSLSALIKNKNDAEDPALLAKVEEQLDLLDEVIRSTPGKYICGVEMTLADLYLLPQLFHAMVTMDHFKGAEFFHIEGDPTRPALENYLARLLDMPEFNDKRVYYNVDSVISGWKTARGE